MNHDGLKLTVFLGDRDRHGGRFVADALLDLFARERVHASLALRGAEGFGMRHRLQTQQLLSLSEDLPVVAVAVDARPRIQSLLEEVQRISRHGLITLERIQLDAGGPEAAPILAGPEAVKLTAYVGRQQRVEGVPATRAVVEVLHRHGAAGACALLGVDGTLHGKRRRARFFAANAEVPVMVLAVGPAEGMGRALAELGSTLAAPLTTLERVRVCKRDGVRVAEPHRLARADAAGLPLWQKLSVYSGEGARHDGRPLHGALIRRLRAAGADGATSLRGFWGFWGEHPPHGDRFFSLRRRVPVLTVIVDTPERIQGWFQIVDELTAGGGLVSSEIVPALRAGAPGARVGELVLALPER